MIQRNFMHPFSAVCCSLSLLIPIASFGSTQDPATIHINTVNVNGGGFQSDVTISSDGLTVYSSADVSGVFKSSNGGLHFEGRNLGLMSPKVASIAITPDNDQIIYAGTGDKGTSGGLFRSINGGDSWALTGQGDKAQFSGNHTDTNHPVPIGHPRSNGDLIVVDEGENSATHTDDVVIAGTYNSGVILFAQGGEKAVSTVNANGFVRAVARNPSLSRIAYAAIQFADTSKSGIYKIDYSNVSAPISTLEYATARPEGLTVLNNGHVYGAIGDLGIVSYSDDAWTIKNSGLSTKNPYRQWTAITGYVSGNKDIVYAGTNNLGGRSKGSNYSNIWRSENGGDSWTPLVDANSNVSDIIFGQSHSWWFRTDAFGQAGLGRTNSVVSSIAVARGPDLNRVSDDIVYVSGRGGIWRSGNGGKLWEPAVNNMQATANTGIAVNPKNPDQIVIANTDYVVLETSDSFKGSNLSRDKPRGAESRGYDIVFDSTSDEVILGVGDRDTNNPGGGEVYKKAATKLGSQSDAPWINTQLRDATSANSGRVRAISYGYHDGTNATTQTILAAVEGEGVYRYHKGTWTKSQGVTIGSTKRSKFVWPDNGQSGTVYLLDLTAGLYRSNDGGKNWTNIWPSMRFRNNNFYNTGYITADDKHPTNLYLSVQGDRGSPIGTSFKVYKLTGADTAIFGKPGSAGITDLTKQSSKLKIKRPGPIVIGPEGRLWLTQQQDSKKSIFAALYVMDNPRIDKSFTEITSDQYRFMATSPSGITVASDGHLYMAQNGNGVLKISLPCAYTNSCK